MARLPAMQLNPTFHAFLVSIPRATIRSANARRERARVVACCRMHGVLLGVLSGFPCKTWRDPSFVSSSGMQALRDRVTPSSAFGSIASAFCAVEYLQARIGIGVRIGRSHLGRPSRTSSVLRFAWPRMHPKCIIALCVVHSTGSGSVSIGLYGF